MEVAVTNFGCTIAFLLVTDKKGNKRNLVLGYDKLEDYISDPFYIGCIVGRFANRISDASFSINDKHYQLTTNERNTGNHLHGGEYGFNKKVFTINNTWCNEHVCMIEMFYKSIDGEEGYPSNLDVMVTYTLTVANELKIDYHAITDYITPVNLTNHSYFNLSGNIASAVDHELYIQVDKVLIADANYIPTGQLQTVANAGLDFRTWRTIAHNAQHINSNGFNHYYIFNPASENAVYQAALRHPASGITMTVATSYPGMMLYTGDYLEKPFIKQQGICLETHLYPDSPNRREFPQAFLAPNEVYHHYTIYRFYNTLTS